MDLNFAPKLRQKHNARKEWVYEGTVLCVYFSLQISLAFPESSFKTTISVNWELTPALSSSPSIEIRTRTRSTVCFNAPCDVDLEFPEWEVRGELALPPFHSLAETPVVFIDTEEKIVELIETLKAFRCISVSVIQHSYRSYLGYCSMIMVRSSAFAGDEIDQFGHNGLRDRCDPDPQ